MTHQETQRTFRPFAVVLAVAAVMTFWIPTVTTPAHSQAPAASAVVVVAAPGAYAPVLM
ncbi:hypothetical protein [Novosphingobium album (ex Hu et al. 2023)]|uniref:Uncharacterized protein n=1 Tax=Novosphingobium album (ex Hu et al. 2023) TaxID=2930093 RepID=A0ABT0B5R2_9SPHN|nr:hypothetical protein [Novosphingobium album (ex Hu et al. 2023)]MCJ2180410.1 hypothetical protein [Novosphingobium album (ex Hu et al. 2023)]